MRKAATLYFSVSIIGTLACIVLFRGYEERETHFKNECQSKDERVGNSTVTEIGSRLASFRALMKAKLGDDGVQDEVIRRRLDKLHGTCSHTKATGTRLSGKVWAYPKLNMFYCYTPKAGCTYWKRLMRFIAGEYPDNKGIKRPEDIDRFYTHTTPGPNLHVEHISAKYTRERMTNGFSFLFVRNPHSRLWSAYIDKFLLPDFWLAYGTKIVRRLRKNATTKDIRCGNNVSFREFIEYIISEYPKAFNEHWEPMSFLCAPCLVSYDVIGKLETFQKDSENILSLLNMKELSSKSSTNSTLTHIQNEISAVTKFNFDLQSRIPADCFSNEDIAQRLWKTFQLNGYIHRNISIPLEDMIHDNFSKHPTRTFIEHSFRILTHQNEAKLNLTQQRKLMMQEAYNITPGHLKETLLKIYQLDFDLFGYDPTEV